MPGMGGRALAERLAQVWPDLPVLYTSGYTDGEIVRRGLIEPGAAFVQKPFAPETIARAVRERLEAASLPATPRPTSGPGPLDPRESA
jgi:two-component system cell cycle sensor histidine kinase/response regulator CckA